MIVTVGRKEVLELRPQWLGQTKLVTLPPLGPDDVKVLLRALMEDEPLPAHVERYILEAGQGNPLYIQEILKMLLEENLLQRVDGRWQAPPHLEDFRVPRTIQALLAARLERLPSDERVVVQHGSVVGKEFWFGAVQALTTEELRQEIGRSLQSLVRRDLLEPQMSQLAGEDSFRFAQTLMRDAAYNALPKEHRAELHEKVAAWLRERAGDRVGEYEEILGYHLEQAALLRKALGLDDAVTDELTKEAGRILAHSGRRALGRGDLHAAVALLRRGLVLVGPDSPMGLGLSVDLSRALMEAGELQEASGLATQAIRHSTELNDPKMLARARLQACALQESVDHDRFIDTAKEEIESLIEQMAALGDELGQTRALILLADYYWDLLQTEKTQELLLRALPLARAVGDRVEEGRIQAYLSAAAFWGTTHVHEAIELCEEILKTGSDDQIMRAKTMTNLAGLHAMNADFEQARKLITEGRRLQQELGQELTHAHTTQIAGMVELLAGDPKGAIDLFRYGLVALESMGEQAYLSTQAALLARALYMAGELDEAYEMTLVSERAADASAEEEGVAEWGPTRLRILAERGELKEAARLAEKVIAASPEVEDVISLGDGFTAVAELFVRAGDTERARTFYQDALTAYEAKGVKPFAAQVQQRLSQLAHSA